MREMAAGVFTTIDSGQRLIWKSIEGSQPLFIPLLGHLILVIGTWGEEALSSCANSHP